MHSFILFLSSAESLLGRLDKDSFPQQTLMEIFIEGITKKRIKEKIRGSQEKPEDIEDWKGVTLNEAGEVIEIRWFRCGLEGTLNLEWLPSTVREVIMYENNLTGSIQLETLPPSMKKLFLCSNKFSGEIDLTHLPDGLEELSLSENQLSGPLDLTRLPASLQALYLRDNNFLGETDFSKLPESLKGLTVSNTQLSGVIHVQERKDRFRVSRSNVKIVIAEDQS